MRVLAGCFGALLAGEGPEKVDPGAGRPTENCRRRIGARAVPAGVFLVEYL